MNYSTLSAAMGSGRESDTMTLEPSRSGVVLVLLVDPASCLLPHLPSAPRASSDRRRTSSFPPTWSPFSSSASQSTAASLGFAGSDRDGGIATERPGSRGWGWAAGGSVPPAGLREAGCGAHGLGRPGSRARPAAAKVGNVSTPCWAGPRLSVGR